MCSAGKTLPGVGRGGGDTSGGGGGRGACLSFGCSATQAHSVGVSMLGGRVGLV
jgi:hypothetical protein